MKKHAQSGFAIVELVVVVVILAAVAAAGYYVWHNQKNQHTTVGNTPPPSNYQSPSTATPAAPQVNSATDLNGAMQALNQTDVAAGNADNSQLSTQASGF